MPATGTGPGLTTRSDALMHGIGQRADRIRLTRRGERHGRR